ncbi:MAG TPA: hypothetical protein VIK74_07980 [Parasegetibacter sp.]|jgi:hypothetical protein
MKKVLVAILAVFYLTITSGIAFSIHYCMGKQSGISLTLIGEDEACACGSGEKANDCCRTELKLIKIDDNQQKPDFKNIEFSPFTSMVKSFFDYDHFKPADSHVALAAASEGPPKPSKKIHILNRNLRL